MPPLVNSSFSGSSSLIFTAAFFAANCLARSLAMVSSPRLMASLSIRHTLSVTKRRLQASNDNQLHLTQQAYYRNARHVQILNFTYSSNLALPLSVLVALMVFFVGYFPQVCGLNATLNNYNFEYKSFSCNVQYPYELYFVILPY